jgi:hypothetical protein
MCTLGAMCDASRLNHMAKQAQISQIETHGGALPSYFAKLSFEKCPLHKDIIAIIFRVGRNNRRAAKAQSDLGLIAASGRIG